MNSQQIIDALDCFKTKQPKCGECPFNPRPGRVWPYGCIRGQGEVIAAAQEALRTMEPRVLSLDEIHRGIVVWLEDIDKPDVILAIGGSSAGGAKCFVTQNGRSIAPLDEDYGKLWRAWTHKPTDEQRRVMPWLK